MPKKNLSSSTDDFWKQENIFFRQAQALSIKSRAANHYDMEGHGAKAEEHLRAAEGELGLAIDAAKATAK
jgi:hypothetical protein